jgi:hypothetical protein
MFEEVTEMETSQSSGPESVSSEMRILPVEEYREWVHDRVARRIWLCRKFLCVDDLRGVDPVGGVIRRPGSRTVRLP